ncbi:MAG: FKBP-type peptidyl-prolyl cis-trans isomerase [Acidothermus sp.]|nr:FKBP-type peptidyl-prolyl cis-trans isomerase [Acidothermus sp.]MCL6537092.1 FKBP-type peptidyl-prolyl cis-trans isomerase [Acidothermus sp.]
MTSKERRREAARRRYERRQAARAAARARRKRILTIGSAAAAVVVVIGVVLAVVLTGSGNKKSAALASASPSASSSVSSPPPPPTHAPGCTFNPATQTPSASASPTPSPTWTLPAGADPALRTEPSITIPAGPVPITVQTKDLIVGKGETVQPNDTVTVNYVGLNYVDCTVFDSSWEKGAPATFSLSGLIAGFKQGMEGMKVGGRREIIVPPSLGYGSTGAGKIKPNEELVFVVDLLGVTHGSPSPSPTP